MNRRHSAAQRAYWQRIKAYAWSHGLSIRDARKSYRTSMTQARRSVDLARRSFSAEALYSICRAVTCRIEGGRSLSLRRRMGSAKCTRRRGHAGLHLHDPTRVSWVR